MNQAPLWVLLLSLFRIFQMTTSVSDEEGKTALYGFLSQLSSSNSQPDASFGWNVSSDPCTGWNGVACKKKQVTSLGLDNFNLSGSLNFSVICNVSSIASYLRTINLNGNKIAGGIPAEIANCKNLSFLYLGGNQLSGNLPDSLSMLGSLKELNISNNRLSGPLPGLSRISGLTMFLAQNNQLTGDIPQFDFLILDQFNVSNNHFGGPIPDVQGRFSESSFLGNPNLCGAPLTNNCPDSKGVSKTQILMYSGYIALGIVCLSLILCRLLKRKKVNVKVEAGGKVVSVDHEPSESLVYKTSASKSECSAYSAESAMISSSLVVLTSPTVNGLKFEDLLRAPAELLGRGKHGTLYKVVFGNGMILAVKRIKDWVISTDAFKQRMQRINQANHPNVLPVLAFYSSNHEKLLVYEYQQNGSLFKILHGNQMVTAFDWGSRLSIAASIAEALAFIHRELQGEGIAHGNLKSSNIMLNNNMEPCISEYGLMPADDQPPFKADIYGFGVILLELLTKRLLQSDGIDLPTWVHSVVREEWTVEVFDKSLISEGASEERMVSLLQVAIKCVDPSPEARPDINQVAALINNIREEEDRSSIADDA